jgi:hypothetical protein
MSRSEDQTELPRGRGLTNGCAYRKEIVGSKGLVNGNGFVNGDGLSHEKGLVNGNGLVNGISHPGGRGVNRGLSLRRNRYGIIAEKDIRVLAIGLIALLFLTPLVASLVGDYRSPNAPNIVIDGDFTDWSDVQKYSEAPFQVGAVPDISLVDYTIDMNDEMFSVYVNTTGNIFSHDDPDMFAVFIDADGDENTGYRSSNELGSEYAVEIYGWNGSIQSSIVSEFSETDNLNFSAWNTVGNVKGAINTNRLEAQFPADILDDLEEDFKVVIQARDSQGRESRSMATLSKEFGSLMVYQKPLAPSSVIPRAKSPVTQLIFEAVGSDVTVTDMVITASHGTVMDIETPFLVRSGTKLEKEVTLDANGVSSETLVELKLEQVEADRYVRIAGMDTKVYIDSFPYNVTIDGLFEDWNGLPNIVDDGPSDAGNWNIDIQSYTTVQNDTNAYFMLEVTGEMFAGTNIPKTYRRPPESAPTNGTPVQPPVVFQIPRVSGEDVTRIFIDSNSSDSTGLSMADIKADHMIEIMEFHSPFSPGRNEQHQGRFCNHGLEI